MQRALRGAHRRRLAALHDATLAAWVGAHTDKDGLRDFLDGLDDSPKKPLPPQAQARALESLRQKLPSITMEEYRARLRGA